MSAVADAGRDAGKAAGSWVFDGNTSEDAIRRVLAGVEDIDPEIMDMQPSPLSGEWADGPTPTSLQREFDIADDDLDDACTEFEQAFGEGFWDEVVRSGRAMLGEEV